MVWKEVHKRGNRRKRNKRKLKKEKEKEIRKQEKDKRKKHAKKENIDSSEEQLERPCGSFQEKEELLKKCDKCRMWYHSTCTGIRKGQYKEEFICERCK